MVMEGGSFRTNNFIDARQVYLVIKLQVMTNNRTCDTILTLQLRWSNLEIVLQELLVGISLTQKFTTWANTGLHFLPIKSSMVKVIARLTYHFFLFQMTRLKSEATLPQPRQQQQQKQQLHLQQPKPDDRIDEEQHQVKNQQQHLNFTKEGQQQKQHFEQTKDNKEPTIRLQPQQPQQPHQPLIHNNNIQQKPQALDHRLQQQQQHHMKVPQDNRLHQQQQQPHPNYKQQLQHQQTQSQYQPQQHQKVHEGQLQQQHDLNCKQQLQVQQQQRNQQQQLQMQQQQLQVQQQQLQVQQQQQHLSPATVVSRNLKKIAVVTPEPRQLAKRQKIIHDISKRDVADKGVDVATKKTTTTTTLMTTSGSEILMEKSI